MKTHAVIALGLGLLSLPAFAQAPGAAEPKPEAKPEAKPADPSAEAPQGAKAEAPGGAKAGAASPAGPESPFKTLEQKAAYGFGLNIGRNLKNIPAEIDPDIIGKGIRDGLAGGPPRLSDSELRATMEAFDGEMKARQAAKQKNLAEANKKKGEEFLAANAKKEGVVTLPSGLQYQVLKAGTGKKPAVADTVIAHYRGTLINGTEFDSSFKRGEPTHFPVGNVIKGWTEALQLMAVGAKWKLFIPSNLAYMEHGMGRDIGPHSTLIFELELMGIEETLPVTPTGPPAGQPPAGKK